MTSWITLLSLCLACAALLLSVNGGQLSGDTPTCLNSIKDCEGKPESRIRYPKCGVCDRFIRCKKKAKEILCPSKRPVFGLSLRCRPEGKDQCAGKNTKSVDNVGSGTA